MFKTHDEARRHAFSAVGSSVRGCFRRIGPLASVLSACCTLIAPAASPAEVPPGAHPIGHIFLIVMENRGYQEIIGRPEAPYVNGLAGRYASSEAYFAVAHPSLPNYLALLGGDIFGIISDCTDCLVDAPNLADELESQGRTWKSYQEDLPFPCYGGDAFGGYVAKHNPFAYFRSIRDDATRCQNIVPLAQLDADLAAGAPPDFVWITPNLIHDMHDGSVAEGDHWLSGFVPSILASDAWKQDGVLVIVWDESDSGGPGGGRVPLLVLSPSGRQGYRSSVTANHYSLLRSIEDVWGLGYVGHSQDPDVQPITDLFPIAS